jgi:hypothetical protein
MTKFFGIQNGNQSTTETTSHQQQFNSEKANRMLAMCIATSALPLSFCDSEYVRAFLGYISGGAYDGVGAAMVTKTLKEMELKEIRPSQRNLLSIVDSVSCTTDFWTDIHRRPMGSITCHFVRDGRLHRQLLAMAPVTGRHTAENITKWLSGIFSDFSITKKIWACTADGASAQQKAVSDVAPAQMYTLWCACHRLHLVIMDAMKRDPVGL